MRYGLALLLVLSLTGCGPSGQASPTSRIPALPTSGSRAPTSTSSASASPPEDVSLGPGEELFRDVCAQCHIAPGVAPELRQSDLGELSPLELHQVLTGSSSQHPRVETAQGQLTISRLEALLSFLQSASLATPSGEDQDCSECHWDGRTGEGH